jgi:hypothetical protein
MKLHSQASLSGLSDEIISVIEPINKIFESLNRQAKIVPTEYAGCIGFSLTSIPRADRESVANLAWKSLGRNYLVHLFRDRFIVQYKKPS